MKTTSNPTRLLLLALVTTLAHTGVNAQSGSNVPESISVQMLVTDSITDLPVDTPSVSVAFTLYKDGISVWTETQAGLAIQDGILNAILGGTTVLDTVAFNEEILLGVAIGADPEITPRVPLIPAPYALAMRGMNAVWSNPNGSTAGYNIVGGSEINTVSPGLAGVTISGGGGFQNGLNRPNAAKASWSTIGGGVDNQTQSEFATIGGGRNNVASGQQATVGGGVSNTTSGNSATIGGGSGNSATVNSVVGGGIDNAAATNAGATVAGGEQNIASGQRSVIGGGRSNQATALHSTVGGGFLNMATNNEATVVGGSSNVASGDNSTVLGGESNQASGDYSVAAGFRAAARHNGTFVWRDRSAPQDTFSTTGVNQFIILAEGGVGINTNTPTPFPLQVGDSTVAGSGSGAHLTGGGTWTNGSSRAFKTAFEPVDASSILNKVAELAISTWEYKGSDEGRHIGPIAEDFAQSFGTGSNERYISTVDADGVALAAIQGLYALVREQQARIEQLEQRLLLQTGPGTQ